jgi:probable phosphoglycerate mutase
VLDAPLAAPDSPNGSASIEVLPVPHAIGEVAAGPIAAGTRLAIIRHGEAASNAEDFIGGHAGCRGLTARGVAQARALAARLERTGELAEASAFYTSVLPRAIETAEIVATGLPARLGVPAQRCELCERHPGEADGLSWAQYEERYQRSSLPGEDPELPLSPGGESWVDFVARAAGALVGLAVQHPGELVVVVAHGGIVDASMIAFLGLPAHGSMVRLHVDNTSVTEWQHTGRTWRLVRYNDAAHLADPDWAEHRSPVPAWVATDPSLLIAGS